MQYMPVLSFFNLSCLALPAATLALTTASCDASTVTVAQTHKSNGPKEIIR
jgi:hypothetical protein